MLTQPGTTHMFFGQPSTIPQPSGTTVLVDVGRLGFARSNWISGSETSASILCGNVRKTDVNGRKSWRQLCSCMGMPPDEDDDVE